MKLIKEALYIDLDAETDTVECRVTYLDGTQEVFFEDEDLLMVQRQLQRQSRMIYDPLRP